MVKKTFQILAYQENSIMWTVYLAILLLVTGAHSSPKTVEQFSYKINENLFNDNSTSNAIWSPVSVYSSLLPFLNGAAGPTLSELQSLLGIQSPEGISIEMKMEDTNLSIITGLFIQKDVKLRDKFSSGFSNVVTFENPNNLTQTINSWMKNSTLGLIPTVVENMQSSAKMIVVNGVAFKGTWRTKFKKEKSVFKPFLGIKKTTQVEMMLQKSVQNYGRFSTLAGQDFEVMKMGYRDSSMHIVLVIPEKTENLIPVYKYVKQLESNKLGEILERLEPTELEIELPKIKVESRVGIQQALEKAGLKSIFSPMTSNLANMFEESTNTTNVTNSKVAGLHIDEFVHKTVFELDEEGTKAGAATAAIFLPLSALTPKSFIVDKPFIVFLRWQGKWTFFEGIVTDLEGSLLSSQSDSNTNPVINIQPQQNLEPQNATGSENTTNTNITQQVSRRNISNGGEKWWVHNGNPEYLTSGKAEDGTTKPEASQLSKEARFQQPEPKDPYGIRFPIINGSRLKHKFLGTFHGERINPFFVSEE